MLTLICLRLLTVAVARAMGDYTPQAKSGALPIAIYEWVRNNVEYVPTWGSIQGADHCLQTMKCNSFDTSSLLVALFRVNGIHARYVTLTGEISIEKFMNSMGGFTNATAALDFAATGGMPVTGLMEGGKVKAVRFEQVIVEGWVDMFPSFGAEHVEGDYWVRFDPSMKGYEYTQGMDISEAVPFDAEGLVNQIVGSATINEAEGWVTGVDSTLIEQAMTEYRAQVEQYMSTEKPDATVGDVLGTKTIMKHEFPVLMGSLVYKTKAVHSTYREIPDELRHKITFSVAPTSSNYYVDPFSITKSLPDIAGKKVTLSYSPATQADEDVINSYLPEPHTDGTPIDPSELPTSLPAYLINLKPELRIDGEAVATGGSVTMEGWQECPVCCNGNKVRDVSADGSGEGHITLQATTFGVSFGPYDFDLGDSKSTIEIHGIAELTVAGFAAEGTGKLTGGGNYKKTGCPPKECLTIYGSGSVEIEAGPEATASASGTVRAWSIEGDINAGISVWAKAKGSANVTGQVDSCEEPSGSACAGPITGNVGAKVSVGIFEKTIGPYGATFLEQTCE